VAMRHATRRRSESDALNPTREPTWLVVRDEFRTVLESRALAPMADLRAALEAVREARIADGWDADAIGRRTAFFFCKREGKRLFTCVERRDPALPPSLGHSSRGQYRS
jgi:hypothetical protein